MGLFGKSGQEAGKRSGTTIVAKGTRFFGELSLEGKLHIDGTVEGTIHCDGDVSIGRTGTFEGNLNAQRLMVSGHMQGRVECDSLEIVSTGRVYGEIASSRFVIEPGGQFVGESLSRENVPATAADRPPEAAEAAAKEAPAAPSLVTELGTEGQPAAQRGR